MNSKEKEEILQPWMDYINDNDIDVVRFEMNEFETADLAVYKKLYESWVASGNTDVFKSAWGVAAQGISIGCKGGTQMKITYTGPICDLKSIG